MISSRPLLAAAIALAFAACTDAPTATDAVDGLAFAKGGNAACPIPADFVVTDYAELTAALLAATPGQVIGIDGMVETLDNIPFDVPGVTLTCATAGSGIEALLPFTSSYILWPRVEDITIDRLTLDARPIDGSVITGNEVVTLVATGLDRVSFLAGIRARDGVDVVISDNRVVGPWQNGMSLGPLSDSQVERNRVEGSQWFGIATGLNTSLLSRDNVFRNNRATGVGSADNPPPSGIPPAGLLVRLGCNQTFIGNNLQGNFGDVGAIFLSNSGGNTMVGNNNVVFDDGDFDCDDDGEVDPNRISGRTQPGGFGPIISEAASSTGGMN